MRKLTNIFNYKIEKQNADTNSVRSQSPDVGDDINNEIAKTKARLSNLNVGNDNTMTFDSGKNDDQMSQRSRSISSDGSANKKREMKSTKAL